MIQYTCNTYILYIRSFVTLIFQGLATKCKLSAIRALQHTLLLLETEATTPSAIHDQNIREPRAKSW